MPRVTASATDSFQYFLLPYTPNVLMQAIGNMTTRDTAATCVSAQTIQQFSHFKTYLLVLRDKDHDDVENEKHKENTDKDSSTHGKVRLGLKIAN